MEWRAKAEHGDGMKGRDARKWSLAPRRAQRAVACWALRAVACSCALRCSGAEAACGSGLAAVRSLLHPLNVVRKQSIIRFNK
jgi:hypothetical protein